MWYDNDMGTTTYPPNLKELYELAKTTAEKNKQLWVYKSPQEWWDAIPYN